MSEDLKANPKAINSDDIRAALLVKYAPPEWELCFEVGDSTGIYVTRRADAVAINTYPSKGFEVIGFEIKVSVPDSGADKEEQDK